MTQSEKIKEINYETQLFEKLKIELKNIGYDLSKVKIKNIKDNIFAVGYEDKIGFYCDENGKVIFNLKSLRNHPLFKDKEKQDSKKTIEVGVSQIESGYREIKEKDGTYNLYRIKYLEVINGIPTPVIGDKVDKYSLEYYNAWRYIDFANDRNIVKSFVETINPSLGKHTNDRGYYIVEERGIPVRIESQSIRIRDLVSFKEHGQISKEVFDKYMPQVRELLLKQIGDKRFDRVNDGVSKIELDGYLKGGYISQELYVEAIKLMVELGKLDKKILDELKKEIKPKLSELEDEIKLG